LILYVHVVRIDHANFDNRRNRDVKYIQILQDFRLHALPRVGYRHLRQKCTGNEFVVFRYRRWVDVAVEGDPVFFVCTVHAYEFVVLVVVKAVLAERFSNQQADSELFIMDQFVSARTGLRFCVDVLGSPGNLLDHFATRVLSR
jgi:hypothetical protein